MDANENVWIGKTAKIEILKDGKRLIYTAQILSYDNNTISFRDKFGAVLSFNTSLIQQMELVRGGYDGY